MHILVIENERKIADLLRQVLTEEGYHVVVAYDGREGHDLCRLPQFDLLILDLMLPVRMGSKSPGPCAPRGAGFRS